uniref:Uncharacterized protein n=1 Tax=Klebsiella pneumoniae TaxID=573 RepID=A0A6G9HMM4_KLEPN|nr:hypothetical protein [Klebsiella pneumoniae]
MISLSPPTICNSALWLERHMQVEDDGELDQARTVPKLEQS